MIATIAVIAATAEKKKFSKPLSSDSSDNDYWDCCRCYRWGVVSYDRYDRCDCWSFFFLSDHSDGRDHMETGF